MADIDAILGRLSKLHPKLIDLSLDRMNRLLADLGHPERNLPPVIHIAGTNGKGSTQAMLRAGLEAQGDRVHAYTSPHLAWFNERIRLAGELISEQALIDILEEIEAVNQGRPITFFEVTTAAAFLAFSRTPADWLLLEVGLGGRYDATNVIDAPAVSVITPVSIDHVQFLGDKLEGIALEKAGILKAGRPAVVARQQPEGMAAIEAEAARLGAPLTVAGQDFDYYREGNSLIFQDESGLLDLPLPSLTGPHQIQNAGTALAVLRLLGASDTALRGAVTNAVWPARMQRLKSGPLVLLAQEHDCELWLDGGHNAAGGVAIAATLAEMTPKAPLHLVCGMLNTKDVRGYMQPLAAVAQSLTAVDIPGEDATLPAAETAAAAKDVGLWAVTTASTTEAVGDLARQHPGSRILICGSLYLAGRVLRENA